jgi:hypothetical protein
VSSTARGCSAQAAPRATTPQPSCGRPADRQTQSGFRNGLPAPSAPARTARSTAEASAPSRVTTKRNLSSRRMNSRIRGVQRQRARGDEPDLVPSQGRENQPVRDVDAELVAAASPACVAVQTVREPLARAVLRVRPDASGSRRTRSSLLSRSNARPASTPACSG